MIRGLKLTPMGCLLLVALLWPTWRLIDWGLVSAVFLPDSGACAATQGQSACWGVIPEKWRVLLFGLYPAHEVWRPAVWSGVATAMLCVTSIRERLGLSVRLVGWLCLLVLTSGPLLMGGGFWGLSPVEMRLWGGLPLTLLITGWGLGLAFPWAIVLTLGRHSALLPARVFCTVYIEALRSLPLVAVLFLAAFGLPLVLPGSGGELLPRVVVTIALFAAAYLAEVIRGGLQSVPEGQPEAAMALGLRWPQVQKEVVLPQALKACAPGLVNSAVTLFKECSLVSIVSLYELTGALSLALSGDAVWRQYTLEAYLFIALVYWVYCSFISKIGQKTNT